MRRCARPGCSNRAVHSHHVVYQQHVRREGGDVRAPANLIGLCLRCHVRHHEQLEPIPLAVLVDETFGFARDLLGAGAAYEYLRRRYAGGDPRLDALLAESE